MAEALSALIIGLSSLEPTFPSTTIRYRPPSIAAGAIEPTALFKAVSAHPAGSIPERNAEESHQYELNLWPSASATVTSDEQEKPVSKCCPSNPCESIW